MEILRSKHKVSGYLKGVMEYCGSPSCEVNFNISSGRKIKVGILVIDFGSSQALLLQCRVSSCKMRNCWEPKPEGQWFATKGKRKFYVLNTKFEDTWRGYGWLSLGKILQVLIDDHYNHIANFSAGYGGEERIWNIYYTSNRFWFVMEGAIITTFSLDRCEMYNWEIFGSLNLKVNGSFAVEGK